MLSASTVCRRVFAVVAIGLSLGFAASPARADVVPQPVEIPQTLTLDEALRMFKARGVDLLIAEAQVMSVEGDVRSAGAVPNPIVGVSYGRSFGYDPNGLGSDGKPACADASCSANTYSIGL